MGKQLIAKLGLVSIGCILALWGAWAVSAGSAADTLRPWLSGRPAGVTQTLAEPQASVQAEASAQAAEAAVVSSGTTATQSFTLRAGWNTIYLEVEPSNPSPLVNLGTAEQPVWSAEKGTLEAILGGLTGLESVWTWSNPLSRVDYIVDPAEGLWNEPGWKRYFPEGSLGENGESLAFLTDLVNLHANTGYLVKMADDLSASVQVTLSGQPVIRRRSWTPQSYTLTGFPVHPTAAPTVGAFFAGSPISEVYRLNVAGSWVKMANADKLGAGKAYLVYYGQATANSGDHFVAPLAILDSLLDGLRFSAGIGSSQLSFDMQNLSGAAAQITVSLLDPGNTNLALRLEQPQAKVLQSGPAQFSLASKAATRLTFAIRSAEQQGDGAGIVEVASPALGVRWLIPVQATGSSKAGLWVGEVVVNDVSEGRLGGTNVADGELTVALRSLNQSGVEGAAQIEEVIAGNTASLDFTVTLALPEAQIPLLPPAAITGVAPFVGGHIYQDLNQNGQRDGDEPGLGGGKVQLQASAGNLQIVVADDGSWHAEALANGVYTVTWTPATVAGFTTDYPVTEPLTPTQAADAPPAVHPSLRPWRVTVAGGKVTRIIFRNAQNTQTIVDRANFAIDSLTGDPIPPLLNLGYVPEHIATLWTTGPGGCGDRLTQTVNLGRVKNGQLTTTVSAASLNPPPGPVDNQLLGAGVSYAILIQRAGQDEACGEVVVGAPTYFENGLGSEFHYRLLLRVDEDGRTELLPHYVFTDGLRVSAVVFSITKPVTATGHFTDPAPLLGFLVRVKPEDPLNPYKHKYHPDHDNLDARFNPMDLNGIPPYLWESYEVQRRIQLTLTDAPPIDDPQSAADLAAQIDWGGAIWGGRYQEVTKGIHKNDITVKGYFVIQKLLPAAQLRPQDYD